MVLYTDIKSVECIQCNKSDSFARHTCCLAASTLYTCGCCWRTLQENEIKYMIVEKHQWKLNIN